MATGAHRRIGKNRAPSTPDHQGESTQREAGDRRRAPRRERHQTRSLPRIRRSEAPAADDRDSAPPIARPRPPDETRCLPAVQLEPPVYLPGAGAGSGSSRAAKWAVIAPASDASSAAETDPALSAIEGRARADDDDASPRSGTERLPVADPADDRAGRSPLIDALIARAERAMTPEDADEGPALAGAVAPLDGEPPTLYGKDSNALRAEFVLEAIFESPPDGTERDPAPSDAPPPPPDPDEDEPSARSATVRLSERGGDPLRLRSAPEGRAPAEPVEMDLRSTSQWKAASLGRLLAHKEPGAVPTGTALRNACARLVVGGAKHRADLVITRKIIKIGRDGGNHFVVSDRSVSKIHARIFWASKRFVIEDLGSTNGTRLGGLRLGRGMRARLLPHTAVRVGRISVLFLMQPLLDDGTADPDQVDPERIVKFLIARGWVSRHEANEATRAARWSTNEMAAGFVRDGILTPEQWVFAHDRAFAAGLLD